MSELLEAVKEISESPEYLLDSYQPESSVFFSSSSSELLAQAPFASLLVAGMKDLPQQVKESLRLAQELGFDRSIVVGAIPFNVKEHNYLRVSTNFKTNNIKNRKKIHGQVATIGKHSLKSHPSPETYIDSVKSALKKFAQGDLNKVVLSRTLEIECDQSLNINNLLKNLDTKNQHGYTFAINLNDPSKPLDESHKKTLIGASPELLISKQGNKIIANPLAGSEARSDDSELDQANAQQLLNSPKDRYEHELVIREIEKALKPFCKNLNIPKEPSLVNTATMWHLSTRIEGELIDPEISSLTIALAMHPTPAVCGYPTNHAKQAIKELESYQRDLFTGMVGWTDASGDGEWVVTIRCAEVSEKSIRLYAGAGIVEGSKPEKELAETEAKFNTMKNALGI